MGERIIERMKRKDSTKTWKKWIKIKRNQKKEERTIAWVKQNQRTEEWTERMRKKGLSKGWTKKWNKNEKKNKKKTMEQRNGCKGWSKGRHSKDERTDESKNERNTHDKGERVSRNQPSGVTIKHGRPKSRVLRDTICYWKSTSTGKYTTYSQSLDSYY